MGQLKWVTKGDVRMTRRQISRCWQSGLKLIRVKLESMYNDPRRLEAFIQRASTHIGYNESHGCKHFEIMQHLKQDEPRLFTNSLEKVALLTEHSFQDIVNNIPVELMSDLRKNILTQVLIKRRNIMVEMR
jgi:hypothetical protein